MCLHAIHRNNALYESNPQVKLSSSIGLDTSVLDPPLSASTCSVLDIVYRCMLSTPWVLSPNWKSSIWVCEMGLGTHREGTVGKRAAKWSEGGSQIRDRSLIENTGPGWKIVPGGEYGGWQLNNRTDIPCSSWQHCWVGDSWTRRLHDSKVSRRTLLCVQSCVLCESPMALCCVWQQREVCAQILQ